MATRKDQTTQIPETDRIEELKTSGIPAGRVIETDLDTFASEEAPEPMTPFATLVRTLQDTVETGAPIPGTIQQAMNDIMPPDREAARAMVAKLERFRVAAERAASVASEVFYARFH